MAIRWTRSDYVTLGKAVANYNRKVNELEKLDKSVQAPPKIDYNTYKNEILTRAELKRRINSLKRINAPNALSMVLDEKGLITEYEKKERQIAARTITRRLNKEVSLINKKEQPYLTAKEMRAKNILKNLNKYDTKSLDYMARADLKDLRAINYRAKYLESMKKYENFDGYEQLMQKLNSFTNPTRFYEFIKDNIMSSDLAYQWYNAYNQEGFYLLLQDWGVDINTDMSEIEMSQNEAENVNKYVSYKRNKK